MGPVDAEKSIAEFEARKLLTVEDIARANPRWPAEVLRARHEGLGLWDERTARVFIGRDLDLTPASPPGAPSLVLLADGSPYVPAPAAARLRSMGWAVETIPGTGHHVHIDDRPAFLSRILAWVGRDRAAGA